MTCLLAGPPYATLSAGGLDGLVAAAFAPIAAGWSDPLPGEHVTRCVDVPCVNDVWEVWRHKEQQNER